MFFPLWRRWFMHASWKKSCWKITENCRFEFKNDIIDQLEKGDKNSSTSYDDN